MTAQVLSGTWTGEPSSQVHVIDREAFRLLIEDSTNEVQPDWEKDIVTLALAATVFVTTRSGTRYEIDFDGLTEDKIYYKGAIKVRWATYIRIGSNGVQKGGKGYIGLSPKGSMQFFTNLKDESQEDGEQTIMHNSSGTIDQEVQLVIDWNK